MMDGLKRIDLNLLLKPSRLNACLWDLESRGCYVTSGDETYGDPLLLSPIETLSSRDGIESELLVLLMCVTSRTEGEAVDSSSNTVLLYYQNISWGDNDEFLKLHASEFYALQCRL